MEWDHYEFRIAGHFLSALINEDSSGLDDEDVFQFIRWRDAVQSGIREGFNLGHWCEVDGSGEDWGRCDVTGLFAMRCTVRLMIYRTGGKK